MIVEEDGNKGKDGKEGEVEGGKDKGHSGKDKGHRMSCKEMMKTHYVVYQDEPLVSGLCLDVFLDGGGGGGSHGWLGHMV